MKTKTNESIRKAKKRRFSRNCVNFPVIFESFIHSSADDDTQQKLFTMSLPPPSSSALNNVIRSALWTRSHNEEFLPDTLACLCNVGERECNYLKKRKLAKIACVTQEHDSSYASSRRGKIVCKVEKDLFPWNMIENEFLKVKKQLPTIFGCFSHFNSPRISAVRGLLWWIIGHGDSRLDFWFNRGFPRYSNTMHSHQTESLGDD